MPASISLSFFVFFLFRCGNDIALFPDVGLEISEIDSKLPMQFEESLNREQLVIYDDCVNASV